MTASVKIEDDNSIQYVVDWFGNNAWIHKKTVTNMPPLPVMKTCCSIGTCIIVNL